MGFARSVPVDLGSGGLRIGALLSVEPIFACGRRSTRVAETTIGRGNRGGKLSS